MRYKKLFAPTLKEAPKDATLKSHEYLVRGGFIAQVGSGIYNFMPLGLRVLENIKKVVKEELNNAGAQEAILGFVTPAELWMQSKRFEKYGKELLRFKDRKENLFVLGPTHEEMMVELVKERAKSYKDLPLNLYQINTKFRDEMRPRFGLMRAREFVMKDGYSFHESVEDMQREFALMEETYRKIFMRLGLDFRVVEADSGAIGGSGSKEFMVLSESGEDTLAVCKHCDYAANIEAAKRMEPHPPCEAPIADFAKFTTPNVKSIEEVSDFLKVDPYYIIKCVAKWAYFDAERKPAFFFLRGSDDLQEVKATNSVNANELGDITEEELSGFGLAAGFIGPYALKTFVEDGLFVFDESLRDAKNLVCGANEKDYHFVGADLSQFEGLVYDDLCEVKAGDSCVVCGHELEYKKGIEVGHIFQLGTRYSEPLEARFLDRDGKAKDFVMGTYGIGVSRLISAIIEQRHDARGCIWSKESSPFAVSIIVSNIKDESQSAFAERLYADLKARGVEVLLDDRDDRYGAKMADFELVGIPLGVVVGKGLAEGEVELVERENLEKIKIKSDVAFEEILKRLY